MLKENLLWRMTISPGGRTVKEETFLGAALNAIGFVALLGLLFYVLFIL